MDDTNTNGAVLALWRGLRRAAELGPMPRPRPARVEAVIIADGAAPGFRVEDWLVESGLPWDLATHWEKICDLAGIRVETLFWRPAARAKHASGGPGLFLVDIAALAVHLARWGFEIDPAPLVAAVRPMLKAKKLVTQHELDLLWWERERGGMRDLLAFAAPIPDGDRAVLDNLPSGYAVAAHAKGLLIASPRFGKRRWADALLYWDFDNATAAPAAPLEM